jgi:hypothetical protein
MSQIRLEKKRFWRNPFFLSEFQAFGGDPTDGEGADEVARVARQAQEQGPQVGGRRRGQVTIFPRLTLNSKMKRPEGTILIKSRHEFSPRCQLSWAPTLPRHKNLCRRQLRA